MAGAVMPVDGFLRLLMVRSQAGSGLRGSIWGPRLPPPASPPNAACNPLMPYIGEARQPEEPPPPYYGCKSNFSCRSAFCNL